MTVKGLRGGLLVAGTTSDAGKSVVTAGLCRWLARQGVRVAPYKAQNMSNNSAVTADGAEIGRAQAMQAAAAGVPAEAAMNPVLLKPGSDRRSHVVVLGKPYTDVSAMSYRELVPVLRRIAYRALADLHSRYDVVVCEGAGSPAEINLRATDLANMALARATDMPVIVVGDIDRGGVLASMYGTLALLEPADQALISGFVVNKFRGDPRLLAPGLAQLTELTGRPVLGVLPWQEGLWLDVEDSLDVAAYRPAATPPVGRDVLRVAVVRLPRLSNATDVDALAAEPGVLVRFVTEPVELADADLVVLPGTRATVSDLGWLRDRGLDAAIGRHVAAGRPLLGICGGYQMLGRSITDTVESTGGDGDGLDLLPVHTVFARDKTVGRPSALHPTAYEIHHGIVAVDGDVEGYPGGVRLGPVTGTVWHGLLEDDRVRREYLDGVAAAAGRSWQAGTTAFADVREARLDALADLVADNLDTGAVRGLIANGAPKSLPFLPPGAA